MSDFWANTLSQSIPALIGVILSTVIAFWISRKQHDNAGKSVRNALKREWRKNMEALKRDWKHVWSDCNPHLDPLSKYWIVATLSHDYNYVMWEEERKLRIYVKEDEASRLEIFYSTLEQLRDKCIDLQERLTEDGGLKLWHDQEQWSRNLTSGDLQRNIDANNARNAMSKDLNDFCSPLTPLWNEIANLYNSLISQSTPLL